MDDSEKKSVRFAKRKQEKLMKLNFGCFVQGYIPLISVGGLHQLHIFIFFLAVFHVIFSAVTMTLGRAKVGVGSETIFDTFCFSLNVLPLFTLYNYFSSNRKTSDSITLLPYDRLKVGRNGNQTIWSMKMP